MLFLTLIAGPELLLSYASSAMDLAVGRDPGPHERAAAQNRARVGALGSEDTMTGTELANAANLLKTDRERQNLVVESILEGDIPPGSLAWKKVQYAAKDADGNAHSVIVMVAPDYLSVGTAQDHLVAVLGLPLAAKVGRSMGFLLPTSKLVDEVWKAADFRYTPAPLASTGGSEMRKPPYWLKARDAYLAQGAPPAGALVAGHKKDVVASNKLIANPGRLAIYGWHKADGKPIQGVSLFHGQDYADYSHGIRPIHPTMWVDNQPTTYRGVLMDPKLYKLVSNEATPFDIAAVMAPTSNWNMV